MRVLAFGHGKYFVISYVNKTAAKMLACVCLVAFTACVGLSCVMYMEIASQKKTTRPSNYLSMCS